MTVNEIDKLIKTNIDTSKKVCVKGNSTVDDVVDIYTDEHTGDLIFLIEEQSKSLESYLISDLINSLKNYKLSRTHKVLVDCNEYLSIKKAYICPKTNNLILIPKC